MDVPHPEPAARRVIHDPREARSARYAGAVSGGATEVDGNAVVATVDVVAGTCDRNDQTPGASTVTNPGPEGTSIAPAYGPAWLTSS
jgi:hypothetical protein